jgi:hypothetical protein
MNLRFSQKRGNLFSKNTSAPRSLLSFFITKVWWTSSITHTTGLFYERWIAHLTTLACYCAVGSAVYYRFVFKPQPVVLLQSVVTRV